METATEKYLITLKGCRITCNYRQEPQVRITTIGKQGMQVEEKPFSKLFHTTALPFFAASYSPADAAFEVDLDCGAQRWEGSQDAEKVREALVRCGVTREMARRMVEGAVKAAA